jgi:hypothetical protein
LRPGLIPPGRRHALRRVDGRRFSRPRLQAFVAHQRLFREPPLLNQQAAPHWRRSLLLIAPKALSIRVTKGRFGAPYPSTARAVRSPRHSASTERPLSNFRLRQIPGLRSCGTGPACQRFFLRTCLTSRRIASGREGLSFCAATHSSNAERSGGCKRTPISVPLPVAGGPRFFCDNTD